MMYAWTFTLRARFTSSLMRRTTAFSGSSISSSNRSVFSFCSTRRRIHETDDSSHTNKAVEAKPCGVQRQRTSEVHQKRSWAKRFEDVFAENATYYCKIRTTPPAVAPLKPTFAQGFDKVGVRSPSSSSNKLLRNGKKQEKATLERWWVSGPACR